MIEAETIAKHGWVSGRVQGVGFRYFVRQRARQHGVHGWAYNRPDGRVEVLLEGIPEAVEAVQKCVGNGPVIAKVTELQWQTQQPAGLEDFRIG